MAAPKVTHTTDASFETEVLRSDKPTIVDFWAQWCGACRAISSPFLKLAEEYGDSVNVAMLNVDDNPLIASQYGVKTLPTLILFRDGKSVETVAGATPQPDLEALFEHAMNHTDDH